jgi:ribosome-associated heat shock protein Hsp15
MQDNGNEKQRIDKWLWAARFFKTRRLASEAVNGGKVHVGGRRVKSSKNVMVGDELLIRRGPVEYIINVQMINARRGPASEAQKMYTESEESRIEREDRSLQMRLLRKQTPAPKRKPNKKQRRHIIKFIRRQDV